MGRTTHRAGANRLERRTYTRACAAGARAQRLRSRVVPGRAFEEARAAVFSLLCPGLALRLPGHRLPLALARARSVAVGDRLFGAARRPLAAQGAVGPAGGPL